MLSLMIQTISKQYHAALTYLLANEGYGAQRRLATKQNIDPGYMNAIAKGRKLGGEDIRTKIAAHFGMTYEKMLALGRTILDGGDIQSVKESSSAEKETVDFKEAEKAEKPQQSISEIVQKVVEILESGSNYHRMVLTCLIDAFHEAIIVKKENQALQNHMQDMELRIANLEGRLSKKDPLYH